MKMLDKLIIFFIIIVCYFLFSNISQQNYSRIDTRSFIYGYTYRNEITADEMTKNTVKKFFLELKNENYDVAFNMLDDNCKKETFNNQKNDFIEKITEKYIDEDKAKKNVEIINLDEKNKSNEFMCSFSLEVPITEVSEDVFFEYNTMRLKVTNNKIDIINM